ncbi:hypothetical protein [Amycolatopsis sp. NPDC052450]|uniref:hypothetical protein n=1 Tax=Amycolatopsis sp. NPDC052450 TaxID=3363937 RepID=UPI0037C7A5ED
MWWMMQCEDSHVWWRLVDEELSEPPPEDLRCPEDGTEAIVAMRHPLADRVTVALVPAAWEREGKIGFRDRYFLEISSSRFAETLRSARTYSWDKALERLSWFKDVDWEAARRRWTRGDFTKPE